MLDTNQQIKRQATVAFVAMAILGGGTAAWSMLVPLDGAVTATGNIMVEDNVKKVQHQAGGIIGEIRVREGSRVREGDVVLRLDETVVRSNLMIVMNDLVAQRARQARFVAERDSIDAISFPADLLNRAASETEIAEVLASERKLFENRVTAIAGQKAQLSERIGQTKKEIEGLEQQRIATVTQLRVARDELRDLEPLRAKGLVQRNRITSLEREIARSEGIVGDIVARMASSAGRIAETGIQITQLDRDRASEVSKDLRETETKINELNERRIAGEDQLRRVDIRAPSSGVVHQLTVHTVGGVANQAEPLMMIVPESDQLIVEARVSPTDIDQVFKDQSVRVRFTSFNQRTTPELFGAVYRVSPDSTRDQQSGAYYFTVGVRVPDSEYPKLNGAKLLPGMQAETYFKTSERTLMSFLMKPITDNWQKTFSGR